MRYLVILSFFISILCALEGVNGKPLLLPVEKDTTIAQIRNHKIPILEAKNGENFALVAIPYRQTSPLEIITKTDKNEFKTSLHVKQYDYPKEFLSVDPSKVSPPKKVKKRIENEYKEAMKIYATFTPERYWKGPFIKPIKSIITSAYGNARTFNDTLKSYHSGTDFRAPIGTPVYAINDGVIVLSKERYYAGGSVIIDHGEGIYSVYYHLSSLPLAVGTKVKQGDRIGLSGNSGRVTGPHLHFGIMLQSTPTDPLGFIDTVNSIL